MHPSLKKLGSFEFCEMGDPQAEWTIVLFHGYGADAFDLASIADQIDLPAPTRWIFPQGPMTVPIGGGFFGRAWYPIDVKAIERSMYSGIPLDYSKESSARFSDLRDRALKFLKALNTPSSRLIIGGFSQGSMLAVDLALNMPESPAAVIILSGTLVDEENVVKLSKGRPGIKFFQSHGENDSVLPYSGALRLEKTLTSNGWDGYLLNFSGGHDIPRPVLSELQSYLRALVR